MNKEQEKKFFELICVCNNQQQELDKYKNIVDELENRMLLKINRHYNEKQYVVCIADLEELYDKLKELKELKTIDDYEIELDEVEYKTCVDKKAKREYKIIVTCKRSLENKGE